MHEKGFKWSSGSSLIDSNHYKKYKEETCYDAEVGYCNIEYFKRRKSIIIEFDDIEDFLEDFFLLNKFLSQIEENKEDICVKVQTPYELKRLLHLLHLLGGVYQSWSCSCSSLLKLDVTEIFRDKADQNGLLVSGRVNLYPFEKYKNNCSFINYSDFKSLIERKIKLEANKFISNQV